MPVKVKTKISSSAIKKEVPRIRVGVFKDKSKRKGIDTKKGLGSIDNIQKVRRTNREKSEETNANLLYKYEKSDKILSKPFNRPMPQFKNALKSIDIGKISDKKEGNRFKNTLLAIFRTPLLKGKYGSNSMFTADSKGFDKKFIDSGQMFKAVDVKIGNEK